MEISLNQFSNRSATRSDMTICGVWDLKPVLFLSLISFCLLLQTGTDAAPTYVAELCGPGTTLTNSTPFADNSTYKSNLDLLLSSLSNATGYFRNFTAGGRNGPDSVYGIALCRGDVAADLCQECVAMASRDIVRNCTGIKSAIILYDECKLRYSDQSFFYVLDTVPGLLLNSSSTVSDVNRLLQLIAGTIGELATRAANDQTPPEKFATAEKNFTSSQTLYMLAQCTPDLSAADCSRCIQIGLSSLPESGNQWAQVLIPSCSVRYDLSPFYNQTGAGAAPLPSVGPPPGSVTSPSGKKKNSRTTVIAIIIPIAIGLIVLCIGCRLLRSRAQKKYQSVKGDAAGNEMTTVESLQFDFGTMAAATDNFSDDKKIGEGGFGAVYKGILPNGKEVAIKRLSRSSGQGEEEFKNEMVVVAKLQHRKLVRLLGFCVEGKERVLVYEFVANKSLDRLLFIPEGRKQLDWSTRYKIIGGIARGMLYLHEDSRLRIIHRDLKASNILLDEDMNPKVSDFGMAKIFDVDQSGGDNTNKIVGTYGYMSPEYAMRGRYSVKSDVFSFGVLVLEIVSGKRNSNFYQSDGAQDLLSFAWKLWRDGAPMELMDPTLRDTCSADQVRQCIHIGLLCVQEAEADRPTMSTVVLMLNSYSVTLSVPRQPAFFVRGGTWSDFPLQELNLDESTRSVNEVSLAEIEPR